ncbi:MAG: hypothetical protein HY608_02990 [Planctomycetes bacterium]|nr:hypothetical protein [Planctomycetota bacterium]
MKGNSSPQRAVCILWHCHQPLYRDALTGEVVLPWVRLHSARSYADMPERVLEVEGARAVFNLTAVLLEQIDGVRSGRQDLWETVALRPAEDLDLSERAFCLTHFFHVQGRDLERHEPLRALKQRLEGLGDAGEAAAGKASVGDLRDLQVWFHLAWCGSALCEEEIVRSLIEKGTGFTESDKAALHQRMAERVRAVEGAYRTAQAQGAVELSTSPYYHPILPLLCDAALSDPAPGASPPLDFSAPLDARIQVVEAIEAHARRWGRPCGGLWPSEGALSSKALRALAPGPLAWVVTDQALLRSVGNRSGAGVPPDGHLTPYRVRTGEGEVAVFFRDTHLSDRIGFEYANWPDAEQAAGDLIGRIDALPAAGRRPDCVTLALDGENAWGYYPDGGRPFLRALYRGLAAHPRLKMMTFTEVLEGAGGIRALPALESIGTGSWIYGSLGTWAAHRDQRRAWGFLAQVRARGGAPDALDGVHLAESSDWFWWLGNEHRTELRGTFVRLFSSALRLGCRQRGVREPAGLLDWEAGAGGAVAS